MLRVLYIVLDRLRAALIVGISGSVVILCLVQVFMRYFTGANIRPFAWGDEIIRLSSIWVVFLAASLGVRSGAHLSVNFFVKKYFSEKMVIALKRFADVIVLVALASLVWFGTIRTLDNIESSLQNVPISMAWFYASIPVGCAYLFIEYLKKAGEDKC